MAKKQYTGTCFIGAVGSDLEPGVCRDSIERITRRPGDEPPQFARGTKGYETRQTHINNFIDSRHDFLLMLDHDMIYLPDTLERLRQHQLPYVSGLYMRRSTQPMGYVWFRPFRAWPMEPWAGEVKRGVLHKIGASGWGCILIHRDVILAVRELLHGEWEVLEDDMDVWPYDLVRVIGAIKGLQLLVDEKPALATLRPALAAHTEALEAEIKPLRADRDQIGSDIRFPFFALQAGYQLFGDPDCRPGHIVHYPISPEDYEMAGGDYGAEQQKYIRRQVREERKKILAGLEALE